jgi:hypothetical protein
MQIFKSVSGIILALVIFTVVWYIGNVILSLWDTLRDNRNFLQDAFRELFTPGLGAYLAMIGVDKILKEYNKSIIFYGFSIIIVLVASCSIYLMILTAKEAGFDIYDFTMQTLTPIVVIGIAYFTSKVLIRNSVK